MIETTLKVGGMHCSSCGLLIDDVLEDLPGVQRSLTDAKKESTLVSFDPSATSLPVIVQTVCDLGYQAEVMKT